MARVVISIEDVADSDTGTVSFAVIFDPRPDSAQTKDLTPAQVMGAHVAEFATDWMQSHSEEILNVRSAEGSGGGGQPN